MTGRTHRSAVAALVATAVLVGACGGGTEEAVEPALTATRSPGASADALVIDSRPISESEQERVENDDLDCDDPAEYFWDYGPIDPSATGTDRSENALVRALDDINEDFRAELGRDGLPSTGWVELVTSEGSAVFVLEQEGEWTATVSVSGQPDQGIWRYHGAVLCLPTHQ